MVDIIEVKVFLHPRNNHVILAIVKGSDDNIYYLRCIDGVWFCPCPDFNYRGGFPEYYKNHLEGKKQDEQYKCKHIKAVELYLAEKIIFMKNYYEEVVANEKL